MNLGQIKEGTCGPSVCAEKFMPFINDTCDKYQIDTPIRQLCFLAQVGHKSGGLFYTEELASGAAYEGRKNLGNTQPGDGVRFKGRGMIQIAGRSNYKILRDAFGIDLIKDPTLLGGKNTNVCIQDQLKNATRWYWNSRNLNTLSDKMDIKKPIDTGTNLENFRAVTRKINGKENG